MTTFGVAVNEDTNGIKTAAQYGDDGSGANDWFEKTRSADGGHVTIGLKADAAVTNPATAGTVISFLKGIVSKLADQITQATTSNTNLGAQADAAVTTGSGSIIALIKGLLTLRLREDDAHTSLDPGIQALTVRKNTPVSTSGADSDYQPQITDTDGATWVHPIKTTVVQTQSSAGVTTASTNYTSGDQVGTVITFTGMANVSGWGGVITGFELVDKALKLNTGDFEVYIFDGAVTAAADNAPADFSDTDEATLIGKVKFLTADWITFASNAVNQQNGLFLGYNCQATSLFAYLVTRQANAFFTAAGDVGLRIKVLRD
jgi:hypothetical protein